MSDKLQFVVARMPDSGLTTNWSLSDFTASSRTTRLLLGFGKTAPWG